MARARTRQSDATGAEGGVAQLKCPECGRTFTRAAALGAHRRAHGVKGSSAQSRSRRSASRRGASSSATGSDSRQRRSGTGRATANSGRRQGSGTRKASVDRDALLQALFPNGMPARESIIRSVNEWLNEAERLARSA
jgi:C2H2 type zinc finger protein